MTNNLENKKNYGRDFCTACREEVEYEVKEKTRTKTIKGVEFSYIMKEAYCKECGGEINVKELRDENLKNMDDKYREITGTIKVDEIKEILSKYGVGKRPLSLILGWGESTLTRFIDGDIPSKIYSDTLKKVNSDPNYLLELLEKNKDKISSRAYTTCYEGIFNANKLFKNCEELSKIESVANYIISKSTEITPLALQKLLYYSQSFYKVFSEEFLFNEDCQAWVHGPAYKEIYNKYKKHGYNPIEENFEKFNCFNLSGFEIEVVESVLNNFGCYSGKILEKMTHKETPWLKTRGKLKSDEYSNRVIDKKIIEEYFSSIKDRYKMQNLADIGDYSSKLFKEVRSLY